MNMKNYAMRSSNSSLHHILKFPRVAGSSLMYFCRAYPRKSIKLSRIVITPDDALIVAKIESLDEKGRNIGHEVCVERTGLYFGHFPLENIIEFFDTEEYFSWN